MVIPREVKKRAKVNSWSKEIRNIKKTLVLAREEKQILIGTLLGDGSLSPNISRTNFRLEMIQSDKQKSYLDWKAEIFRFWCLAQPHFHSKTKSWRLKTVSHPELSFYHSLFYKNGRKIVPDSIAKLLCSTLSLAVWFMDDGTKGPQKGYTLNSQNFSYSDNKILADILRRNFGLKQVSIHRDRKYYRLYIGTGSAAEFTALVRPHIIPVMFYKLHS